ncbi:fimbria/pilus outer membrane usher protein [Algoriphagus mannitolivorans]|uniref:hypothetical protein n=1 Tax=Algoriphagus mannitolivorans TaxID=226504 RepID=UPI0004057969|nr:hypothetical protein [Algoriphagus mannitolivorans]
MHFLTRLKIQSKLRIVLLIFCFFLLSKSTYAQKEPDGEVLLNFNYPAVGNVYINGAFFGDVAFLPLGEVLSLLYIPYEKTASGKGLQGVFPSKNDSWSIDPVTQQFFLKGKSISLPADDYYIGELDLYLHPEYFQKIFGITFTINTYALSISLSSEFTLPIEERKKREMIRTQLQNRLGNLDTLTSPLLFPREKKMLSLGVFDYNLTYNKSSLSSNIGAQFNLGMELLAGDLQGTYIGNFQSSNILSSFAGIRWRYVFPGGMVPERNAAISSLSIGQVNTSGLTNSVNLLGLSVTNNPVIPRLELDTFVIDGTTAPDSEVELLIGGQLVDFTRANEVGYYRFNAPITYGTVRLSTRIYTPRGEVIVEDRQIQIPFSFLPKGFVGYNLQSGLPQFSQDSVGTTLATHADIAYGITNALTVRAGVDRGEVFGENPFYSVFGLSARIFQQYLINIDALPDRYYRATGSVFYASNTSINAQFTEYNTNSSLNASGLSRDASLNYFFPFQIAKKFSGFRITGERLWYNNGVANSNYQLDFNTQINRIVFRVNYRGGKRGNPTNAENPNLDLLGILTGSLTYTLPRTPSIPVYVRGMFLRGQYRYSTLFERSESISLLLSQTLFKNGRFTLGYDRDFIFKQGQFKIGFLYDFSSLRTSTQFTKRTTGYQFQQSLSGSIAYDPGGKTLIPSNRDQITRSGVTVRLFIDSNENSIYDEGEEIVSAKAVRLDRSGNIVIGSDGLLRITQLQSYWNYRMDVDIASLPNPNLAPKQKSFRFIAEPNRLKLIDVPLYQTGIIDGYVFFEKGNTSTGLGGLRLILTSKSDGKELILRTFNDGSFYTYSLLPGKYTLQVDPKQLEYMQAESVPGRLEFEIKALADGDYLEGLNIVLKPLPKSDQKPED